MKKITIEQAGWIWAVKENKESQYYRQYYGLRHQIEFSPTIGGQIIFGILSAYDSFLIKKGYYQLSFNWFLHTRETFGLSFNEMDTNVALTFSKLDWLLFRAAVSVLDVNEMDTIIDGDWRALFDELDKEFLDYE